MMPPSETRGTLPIVVALLRFAAQGVGLGALAGMVFGAILAVPGMLLGGVIGGVIGWPAGLAAGVGAVLAARSGIVCRGVRGRGGGLFAAVRTAHPVDD